jgi:2'-5' RNA ligase
MRARHAAPPALALLLAACAGAPVASGPSPAPAPAAAAPAPTAGNLFSTIACGGTALGRTWAKLLPEARTRFPGLELTRVEDLHVTVVYVGPGWKREELDRVRALALVAPREPFTSRPEIVRFGATGHVVVAELKDAPAPWLAGVAAAKAEMNRLGLKKPERYDAEFRPHVTLATSMRRPPEATDSAALDAFRAWIAAKAASAPASFAVALGPETPVRLWLAGLVRPSGAPEYVDVDGSAPPR